MAYRLTYYCSISFVGPGQGPSGSPQVGPGAGNAQVLTLINQAGGQNIGGSGTAEPGGNQITSADVTTLFNAMATDMEAQFSSAANLATMQGWPSGNP